MNLRGRVVILFIIFFIAIAAQAMEKRATALTSEEFFQKKEVQAFFLEPAPIVSVKTSDGRLIPISSAKLVSLSKVWATMLTDLQSSPDKENSEEIPLEISMADFAVIAHLYFLKIFDVEPSSVQCFQDLQGTKAAATIRELCHKWEAFDALGCLDDLTSWRSHDEKSSHWMQLAKTYKNNTDYDSFAAIYIELVKLDDKDRKCFLEILATHGLRKESFLVPKKKINDNPKMQVVKSLAYILYFRDQLPESGIVKFSLLSLSAIYQVKAIDSNLFYAIKIRRDGSFSIKSKMLSSKQDIQSITSIIVTVLNMLSDVGLKPAFPKTDYKGQSDILISGLAKASHK